MARKKQSTPQIDPQKARAECFLLCDFARSENGKLYIVGGGWDRIVPQHLPLDYESYLAIKIDLPWETIAGRVTVRVELLDTHGQLLGDPVFDATLEGELVDARSQAKESEEPPVLMATILLVPSVKMALAKPGRFVLRLLVNAESLAETSFLVTPPPQSTTPAVET